MAFDFSRAARSTYTHAAAALTQARCARADSGAHRFRSRGLGFIKFHCGAEPAQRPFSPRSTHQVSQHAPTCDTGSANPGRSFVRVAWPRTLAPDHESSIGAARRWSLLTGVTAASPDGSRPKHSTESSERREGGPAGTAGTPAADRGPCFAPTTPGDAGALLCAAVDGAPRATTGLVTTGAEMAGVAGATAAGGTAAAPRASTANPSNDAATTQHRRTRGRPGRARRRGCGRFSTSLRRRRARRRRRLACDATHQR